MKIKYIIQNLFFIALLLLCTVQPAFAATDSFNFNVNSGNNNLPLGTTYNGSFVTDISGVYEEPSVLGVAYLQKLNVTSNISRDNVLINITVPRNTSSMNADFSDLRFFHENLTEIPYYVSSYNASAANVSIKANLTSGLNQLYIGFGVPGAQSKSDINSIYLYRLNNSSGQPYTGSYTHFTGSYSNINLFTRTDTSTSSGGSCEWYFKSTGGNATTNAPWISHWASGSGGLLKAFFNTSSAVGNFTNGSNGASGYSHRFNLSPNINGSVRMDYQKLHNGTLNQTLVINGNNTTNTPFQLFAHAGNITIYDVVIFNTTSNTYVLGDVSPAGGLVDITIPIPSGLFSSLNFNAPGSGILKFNITYTPYVSEWNLDSVQPNGRLNFSYKPVDTQANYAWEVSSSSAFDQLVLNGIGTPSEINASGFANIYVTDFTNLTPGTYYWRLKSAETGNNTVFASKEFTVDSKKVIEIRIIDGVTGDWLNVSTQNQTSGVQIYPPVNFVGMTAGSFQGRTHSNIWNQINPANTNSYNLTVTQGGNVQIKPLSVEKYGIHWATNTFEANIGEPLTVQINTGNYAWKTQTYTIPLENHTIQDGIFNLSIERPMSNNSTSTENLTNVTHGIVHDSRGEAIRNVSFSVNSSSTGAFIGTFLVQNGGQYAYYNTSVTDPFYFSFFATGFVSVSGAIDKIKQDILLLATHDITISVVDADTNQPIQYFTTYLGDAQTIRSTDNGTVTYENVTEGTYQVIVQAVGYNQISRSVFISEDNQTFTLKVSKISSGYNEIITPLYVTMRVFNQAQNQLYGFTAIIKDDNGNEVFNLTMNYTSQFTVQLDRTKIYTIQIIKAQTQVNQTFTVHGLNDGDQVTLIVKEVVPQQQPTVEQVISYNTTVTEDSQYAYIRVVYTSSIGGYPANAGGTPRLNYIMRESGERGVIEPVSYNTINNTTYIVNYRIPISDYFDMYENTTTFTYNQSFVINGTSGEGTVQYKYVLSSSGQHLIDLGLSQQQYEIIAYIFIFLITLAMATASNVPFTLLSTICSTLFFMYLRWLNPHPFVLQLLAIGLVITLIEIYRRNKTSM